MREENWPGNQQLPVFKQGPGGWEWCSVGRNIDGWNEKRTRAV